MFSNFKQFWNIQTWFEKTKLTAEELDEIRDNIQVLEAEGNISSAIIQYLQDNYPKLNERWKAERAYWTESKRIDSVDIKDNSKELGIKKFIIMPNTGACPLCRKVSGNGRKVFTRKELTFKGRGIPPIHPNCYCIILPHVD